MSMLMTRETGANGIPVWLGIDKDIQLAQGGFLLTPTGLPLGYIIPAGTPLVFNSTTRVAVIMGSGFAQATAGGAATDYLILKGHTLKVGDFLASGAVGGKAYAITVINTTGSTVFDTITVGTSIGAVTAGDFVYASTATGITASAFPLINALLYAATAANPGESVSAVLRGTAYARRVPYSVALAALPGLDDIIYSQSK